MSQKDKNFMDVRTTQHRRKGRGERSLALAIALCFVFSSLWAAGPKLHFNIPAGTLRESFKAFTRQAKIDGYYLLGEIRADAVQTRAVIGEFTITEALTRMLEGSGMKFGFAPNGSVLIEPVGGSHSTETDVGDEVVVTGSHIRGLEAITAPLLIVDRKEKRRAAYGTVQDVLRMLPQNVGGQDEDLSLNQNYMQSSGLNLRGLGSGATLVLVNGRRQPASGIQGDFVDVSAIPWNAVDHIEVLTDGASALYGSDAVAGVVNIIMREDLSGAGETKLRLGSAPGGADETLLSQSFGHHWDGGKLLFTYQYSDRTSLSADARGYAANADKRSMGGSDLRTFKSNPGNILDPATLLPAFGIPSGQDGRSLRFNELLPGAINLRNQMAGFELLPDKESHGAFFTASQDIGDRFTLFAESRYNQKQITRTNRSYDSLLFVPSSNPFFIEPPSGLPFVIVAYNFANEYGDEEESGEAETYTGALSLKARLGNGWQASLSKSYGREKMHWTARSFPDVFALDAALADPNPATAFNPFGSGSNTNPATLEAISATQIEQSASEIRTTSLVVDGPLPDWPTGTPKLAFGIDRRTESLFRHENLGLTFTTQGAYERSVSAAFAELSIPLARRFSLSLASRYETHSDSRNSFNPKIGLRWAATDALRLRGSWSSSFREPTLVDRYDRSFDAASLIPIADTRSASGYSTALLEEGSNPNLHEETSTTWTAGFDLAPRAIPGMTVASTFYTIQYEDQVWRARPPLTLESFLADSEWDSLVIRNPSRQEIQNVCQTRLYLSKEDCLTSSPDIILDLRIRNLSATAVKGVDLELKQALQTDLGQFNFGLNGGYMLSFKQAATRTAPRVDILGTLFGPPRLRLRGTTEWSLHGQDQLGWGSGFAVNYLSSGRDAASSVATHIASWTTFDARVSYRSAESDSWFGDVELSLNAVNVFNQDPPFVNREEGYDSANAKPYGRVISLTLQKSW